MTETFLVALCSLLIALYVQARQAAREVRRNRQNDDPEPLTGVLMDAPFISCDTAPPGRRYADLRRLDRRPGPRAGVPAASANHAAHDRPPDRHQATQ